MNILFIHSEKNSIDTEKPILLQMHVQLGISYIASLLKKHGHSVDLFVVCHRTKPSAIDAYIRQFQPELICFTAVFTEYDLIVKTARHIRATHPGIYLLAGGPHLSLNPALPPDSPFDAICIGEGEWPTLELVNQLQQHIVPHGIPNLWIRHGQEIEKNPPRPFITDLDALPFPERQMWQRWIFHPNNPVTILLGRGCPFQCSYCCNHALRKIAPGTYVRYRSPDNIVEEIDTLSKQYPHIPLFYLEIETIGVNPDFSMQLFSRIENYNRQREKPLAFGINLRITPKMNYAALFEAMRKANFEFVNIGLESGNEHTRKNILRRHYSNEDFYNAVETARQNQIQVHTYVIVGLPGENQKQYQETVKCLRKAQPAYLAPSIFFPYPGTDLYKYCQENHLLPEKLDTNSERYKASLSLPGFSRWQIQKEFVLLNYRVYHGKKPFGAIYRECKKCLIRSSPLFRWMDRAFSLIRFGVLQIFYLPRIIKKRINRIFFRNNNKKSGF